MAVAGFLHGVTSSATDDVDPLSCTPVACGEVERLEILDPTFPGISPLS